MGPGSHQSRGEKEKALMPEFTPLASAGSPRDYWVTLAGLGVATSLAVAQPIQFASEPLIIDLPQNSRHVRFADVTRDGVPDLVLARESRFIEVHRGNGDGTYDLFWSVELTSPSPRIGEVITGDFDADGMLDIAWAARDLNALRSAVSVFFVDSVEPDGLTGQTVTLTRADTLSFPSQLLVSGDVDNDGDLDLVALGPNAGGYAYEVTLFRHGSDRQFEREALRQWDAFSGRYYDVADLALGDADDDGDLDVAVLVDESYSAGYKYSSNHAEVEVLLNDDGLMSSVTRTTTFLPWQYSDSSGEYYALAGLALADLDGDGPLDLVATATVDIASNLDVTQVVVGAGFGNGRFGIQGPFDIGSQGFVTASNPLLRDLNRDGDLDLIIGSRGASGSPFVFEGLDGYQFGPETPIGSGAGPALFPLRSDDLDGDGLWDLHALNYSSSNSLYVWHNLTDVGDPVLTVPPLTRGEFATLTVTGALPGERVYFLYSLAGPGVSNGIASLGGITIDLAGTVVRIGSVVADNTGRAEVTVRVPASLPNASVAVQAVIPRGPDGADSVKTRFFERHIGD